MTTFRACVLLATFAVIALGVVHLRGAQTRAAARAASLELEQVAVRRELWRLQAGVARLRSPNKIHSRIEQFDVTLIPPSFQEPRPGAKKLAYHHAEE